MMEQNNVGDFELSIVVPCYNEAENLPELIQRVEKVVQEIAASAELVVVDDGSTDESWGILLGYAGTNRDGGLNGS